MNWQQRLVAQLNGLHYKRLQRFFETLRMDYAAIAQPVVALMGIPSLGYCPDRTEWQFGGCTFNILMLGVVHQGVAFPWYGVYWTSRVIPTQERIKLFQQFLVFRTTNCLPHC